MKITILTFGTRGDTEPYIALAAGLQQVGHRVTLVAPRRYCDLIQSHGVNAYPMRFDVQDLFGKPEIKSVLKSRNGVRKLRVMREVLQTSIREALEDYCQASQGADFLIQTGVAHGGVEIAGQHGIPMAFAYMQPFQATRAFPSFFFPPRISLGLGGAYNKLTHALVLRAMWLFYGKPLNQWRASSLGLPPWRSYAEMLNSPLNVEAPWLFGYSPSVLPKPSDWEPFHHVTGHWQLQPLQDWQPPADLLRFLDSGPAPVHVGFGSMKDRNPERRTREILRALELTGQRGLLSVAWGGLTRLPLPPTAHYVEEVPYDWLFPRMAAVVHHGGMGTTATGLRSGVPNIIAPHLSDQFAMAQQVARLGVGLRIARMKQLTAEKLAPAIHTALNDSAMRVRAAALGEKIRAEKDGVATAVEVIERYAEDFKHRFAPKANQPIRMYS